MTQLLGQYANYIYSIVRIVVGFMFMLHGTQKLFGFPPMPANMPHMELSSFMAAFLTAGAVIELVCGFLILIGFFSSIAAFIASGEMAVGYFMFHQPQGALPATNGGDAAVLFCFIFLYIAARGSGIWSVDTLRGKANG
jgi:putative oxidoreductase